MAENIFIKLLNGQNKPKPRKRFICQVEKVYDGCPELKCPYFAEIPNCRFYYCISGYKSCDECPYDSKDPNFPSCEYDFPVFLFDDENSNIRFFPRKKVEDLIKLINRECIDPIQKAKKEAEEFFKKLESAEIIKY